MGTTKPILDKTGQTTVVPKCPRLHVKVVMTDRQTFIDIGEKFLFLLGVNELFNVNFYFRSRRFSNSPVKTFRFKNSIFGDDLSQYDTGTISNI